MRISSSSPKTTRALAATLARELSRHPPKLPHAIVVALTGPLGAGKTTFTQGFARGLGLPHTLVSPTFLMVRRYPLRRKKYRNLFHVDAYRLSKGAAKEFAPLGLFEVFADPKNIVLVEWADRIRHAVPRPAVWVSCAHGTRAGTRALCFVSR